MSLYMKSVVLEKQGHIAILTLNRPKKLNALGGINDGEDFFQACGEINKDKNIRCAIITGKGKAFSVGGDLKGMIEKKGAFGGTGVEFRENFQHGIQRVIRSLWNLEVPLIAAVNGSAIGLGNDLALTADIRVASEGAIFGATFINVGLVAGDGGAWLLPRTIGRSRAAELFFTCDLIDAATALEWGLVSYVTPEEQLMNKSLAIAEKICAKPPLATRMTKQMMRQADNDTLENILQLAGCMQPLLQNTEDHQVALKALINKSSAEFMGR